MWFTHPIRGKRGAILGQGMGIAELRKIEGKEEIKDCKVTIARYFVKRKGGVG